MVSVLYQVSVLYGVALLACEQQQCIKQQQTQLFWLLWSLDVS
jgi:hypothetical protein